MTFSFFAPMIGITPCCTVSARAKSRLFTLRFF